MTVSDGVKLYSDVYRPDDCEKHPAILIRQPYSKDLTNDWGIYDARFYVRNGFAVVFQDTRGTGVSEGEITMNQEEREDGYDAVEWVASQPWCDGNVCMMGLSYFGCSQLQAAQMRPAHLRAIAPFMVMGGHYRSVFQPLIPAWFLGQIDKAIKLGRFKDSENIREKIHTLMVDNTALWEIPEAENHVINGLPEYPALKEDNRGRIINTGKYDYWYKLGWEIPAENIEVPCMFGTGWYDGCKAATLEHYNDLIKKSHSELARTKSRLVVGPWVHGEWMKRESGGVDFGQFASGDDSKIKEKMIDWFRYWCSDENISGDYIQEPPVQLFLIGANEWKGYSDWPPVEAKTEKFYLASNGNANTRYGDGTIVMSSLNDQTEDTYIFDPVNPMPGSPLEVLINGSFFIEDTQERNDVLVYTSDVLKEDINVTGNVYVELFASTDAVDTDFFCRLSDVYPDDRALFLAEGMVRTRFRNGFDEESLLIPGEIYRYKIDMSGISNLFKKGHKIRLDITSSSFPETDRNHNTGDPIGLGDKFITANQIIYTGGETATCLYLPVIR